MSNRHLPAGQAMPGGGGPGAGGEPMVVSGVSSRRRPQQQPYAHYQPPYGQMPMYSSYMAPYPGGPYYPPQPHQYQNGSYMHYPQQQQYVRSPPQHMQQYVPMAGVSVPQLYPQPSHPSPVLSTPYQPPPASAAMPVQSPPPPQPQTQAVRQTPEPSVVKPFSKPLKPIAEAFQPGASVVQGSRISPADKAYQYPEVSEGSRKDVAYQTVDQGSRVPQADKAYQYSEVSDGPRVDGHDQPQEAELSPREEPTKDVEYQTEESEFPPRESELPREEPRAYWPPNIMLPAGQQEGTVESKNQSASFSTEISKEIDAAASEDIDSETLAKGAEPTTSETLQGNDKSATSMPDLGSPKTTAPGASNESAKSTASSSNASRHVVPVVPAVPVIPKSSPKETKTATVSEPVENTKQAVVEETKPVESSETPVAAGSGQEKAEAQPLPRKMAWNKLFPAAGVSKTQPNANGHAAPALADGKVANGVGAANGSTSNISENSLAAALRDFRVESLSKAQFIEPRGLENPANMCYMNSVLQVLLFCAPFYDFLDQVSKKASHKFNSETPVLDVLILFMREFRVIESADSVDKLRKKLRSEQLEQYGEPFKPQFVYDAIKPLPEFANIKQGAQQDAQEFLSLILNAIDEECKLVLYPKGSTNGASGTQSTSSPSAIESNDDAGSWLEVGQNQRAIESRSSGARLPTPITRLFFGEYRSEVRRSGKQQSSNTEPFQSLQLDIDSKHINNVVDAIKNLAVLEKLNDNSGHFTKQIRIETPPPILILHLKRFKFDTKGITKIGKKVGYPLELQLPVEALSKALRNTSGASMPKYRLISVVYHHSTQASSGHYTVDVRRQDENEWIRLDDTTIRRVRSEDVAEAGAEEDSKDAYRKGDSSRDASTNRFGAMNDEDEGDWEQPRGKKSIAVTNGNSPAAPSKSKPAKENIKDNKVAYLLFYQRV
ncbi:ubiquitin thiolesterase [Colletotrichum sojae]|uniref:ubiquitinyl hydrolase 1 n=1 Tax=Colletotrichum sojae TaxID=2175907 RepID=A0A8H6N2J0_9PEZI|nr:ubiquitin thiolesterase [Colletotrichum sojae]